jgi:hypothetical protein
MLGRTDALITDPPYGIEFSGKSTKRKKESFSTPYPDTPEYFHACILPTIRVALTHVDRAAIFCGITHLQAYPQATDIGGIVCPNGAGYSSWGFGCYIPVIFYGTSPYMTAGLGGRPTAITLALPSAREEILHPCPKPLAFMRWAVTVASLPGHLVMDLFMGTGTTALACIEAGRQFIGCEIDENYHALACRRIEAAYKQPDLFLPSVHLPQPKQAPLFTLQGA